MKKFTAPQLGDTSKYTIPLIEAARRKRYVDGTETDIFDSVYTVLINYQSVDVRVEDDGTVVNTKDVAARAQAGNPIEISFANLNLTISPKSQYEVTVRGTADKLILHNTTAKA